MENVRLAGSTAGFLCKPCGLTFKDNVSYLNHTHTAQHLDRTGQDRVRAATLADVRKRIQELAEARGLA